MTVLHPSLPRSKLNMYVLQYVHCAPHSCYVPWPSGRHRIPPYCLREEGVSPRGGGTVGRLGKVRIWHRSTVPGYIHNLNLMMQCLYYFGVPRYAFSTENIICIGYTHNKWQKQDSINLSPPQSNSNNNQRTNSLIGIQKTLMAYIFLFESKKKNFSQRWSYQRCSHEFFRHFAQVR